MGDVTEILRKARGRTLLDLAAFRREAAEILDMPVAPPPHLPRSARGSRPPMN